MFPVITLVGRNSVGKSALFNRLTSTCDALVGSDLAGLTRDRRYGVCSWKQCQLVIVDTGGLKMVTQQKGIETAIFNQVRYAILKSDLVLFVVDAKTGVLSFDYDIIRLLYKFQKSVFVVVNKVDNVNEETEKLEFYALGVKIVIFTSALHGLGINSLLTKIFFFLQKRNLLVQHHGKYFNFLESKIDLQNRLLSLNNQQKDIIELAIVGSPNVGKSTFINYVLGENRVIVCNTPGTTRDNVYVSVTYNNCEYILIDTAGLRKKNRSFSFSEELSIIRTLKVIKTATMVLLLIDACNGISNYDLSLLNNILNSGKSVVIAVNKWDLLSKSFREEFKVMCNTRMRFARFVSVNFISALCGTGISHLFKSIAETYRSFVQPISTAYLTQIMNIAVEQCSPPYVYGKTVKLRYAHIGGRVPFVIVIHGAYVTGLPNNYKRYLINFFLHSLRITGFYIKIRFKESK